MFYSMALRIALVLTLIDYYCSFASAQNSTTSPALNVTALTSRDGFSVLECWQLTSIPVSAFSALNYALGGNTTGATWSMIKPRTEVGEAWAPHVQLSMILNGLIRITSPSPSSSLVSNTTQLPTKTPPPQQVAYIAPGTLRSSILIAADLKSTSYIRGHFTEFPGSEDTILVQIPFLANQVPEHVVVGDGPCL